MGLSMKHDTSLSNAELLTLLKNGDRSAFRQLFDRFYTYLVVTVNNVSGDEQMAHDIAQDVFLEVWNKRKTLQIDNLKPYLRRAAINKLLNRIKANRMDYVEPEAFVQSPSNLSAPLEELNAKTLLEAIHRAADELPERCRLIFQLRRLEGLRVKEIARQLDISPKTVENQLTKALKILQKRLKPFNSPDE